MTVFRNVSGTDRVLMVGPTTGVKVRAGDTVTVDDPKVAKGMQGQDVLWQPVTEPETVEQEAEEQ